MVINPNILTINPVIYLLLLVPLIGLWTYAKWGKEKYSTGIAMCILDILPAFSLILMNTRSGLLDWFIVAILFAIISIRVHIVVGAIAYLLIYLAIGIFVMVYNFSIVPLIVSILVLAILIICTFTRKNVDKWSKIGGSLYGIFALIPLLYCFFTTWNVGFLSLVIGDVLLGATQIVPEKKVKLVNYISNIFFYVGVWLVPLSLV